MGRVRKGCLVVVGLTVVAGLSAWYWWWPRPNERDVRVPAGDGVALSTDVYRPTGGGRWPCLVLRTPYGKGTAAAAAWAMLGERRERTAVVVQDCRGRFASDGTFHPFRHERADGLATLTWIRRQPWSNGRVVGLGASYLGVTGWAVADELDGLVAVVTCRDMYDALYPNGVFSLQTAVTWGFAVDGRGTRSLDAAALTSACATLPLAEADVRTYGRNAFWREWLSHPTRDGYWQAMAASRPTVRRQRPMPTWGGTARCSTP